LPRSRRRSFSEGATPAIRNCLYRPGRDLGSPDALKTHIIVRAGRIIVGPVAIAFADTFEIDDSALRRADRQPYARPGRLPDLHLSGGHRIRYPRLRPSRQNVADAARFFDPRAGDPRPCKAGPAATVAGKSQPPGSLGRATRSLSDLGVRREASGRARTNCHDFEAHSGSYATRNRDDLGRSPAAAVESS
jgi:hypothetical protein